MFFTRQHVRIKSHHVFLLHHFSLLRQLPPVFLRDGFLTKVNLPKWNLLFNMHYHTCWIHGTAKNQMTHYVDFTNHLMCFSCSSFIFSWIFLVSTASFILLSCRLLLSQEMSDRAAEYPQIHRLETESAGGSIPLWTCLYLPSRLCWSAYWGLSSTTLPPQQGWRRPSAAPM